ncbi:hypothetical protein CPB86DRAFT_825777 [Serendipita vermifera]|nr:hypothetical protein CPB86DRAFT_825777 [Serendipita vermifera]
MDEQYQSALCRTPTEIWWKILDEVIDIAFDHRARVFATTFEGDDWPEYSHWWIFISENGWLRNARRQTNLLGSVCRSWQAFAQSRNSREVTVTYDLGQNKHRGVERISAARRVTLYVSFADELRGSILEFTQGFNCEILYVGRSVLTYPLHIPLPRLRRLCMRYYQHEPLNSNVFLDIVHQFDNLTWLDYEVDAPRAQPTPLDKDKPPVCMPNLQVLWYKGRATFEFPSSHLILPSLRYLTLHIYELPSRVPLLDILSCYRQTLRYFVAGVFKDRGDVAVVNFPPWIEFPKLEGLVLDQQWTANFEPLPSSHPLQRLEAQFNSFDVFPSLLEGAHMRKVRLYRVRATKEGEWRGYNEDLVMDKGQIEDLTQKSKAHGIELSVFHEEEAKYIEY